MKNLKKKFSLWYAKKTVIYTRFVLRRSSVVVFWALLLTLVSGYYTAKLFQDVRTDFATLLPQSDRSVRQMRYIVDKVGGMGNLFITVSSSDFEQNKKAMQLLGENMALLPEGLIAGFQYNTKSVENYFKKYALYFMDTKDLLYLKRVLDTRVADARLAATGMLLETPNYRQSDKRLERMFKRYKEKNPYKHFRDGYFSTADGKDLVMIIYPLGSNNDVEFSRRLVTQVDAVVKKTQKQMNAPTMEIGITGVYAALLENIVNVVEDALTTGLLTFFLVFLVLYLYYRNVRMIFIMSISIIVGILLTFAISYFKIGYLNQLSVFLGSIIIGNGINFSLMQMSRYIEERGHGLSLRRSLLRSIVHTMPATAMAAFTASIAYGILAFTKFKGFSQFGFMGGIGMLLCWLTAYFLVPSLLTISEKIKPLNTEKLKQKRKNTLFRGVAWSIEKWHKPIVYVLFLLLPLMILASVLYLKEDRFEYVTKNLANRNMGEKGTEYYFGKRVEKIFGNAATPAVLYGDKQEDVQRYAGALQKKLDAQKNALVSEKPSKEMITDVQWLQELLPLQAKEKFAIVKQMRRTFKPKYIKLLEKKDRHWGYQALSLVRTNPPQVQDIPPLLRRGFTEKNGDTGKIFYVTQGKDVSIYNIKDLIAFGNAIAREFPVKNDTIRMASESMIFSDIIMNISREGPWVTAVAFLLVALLLAVWVGNARDFFLIFTFLTLGILAFISLLLLFSLRLNFFNFVAIPITIGIGVDYAINFYFRYRLEGRGHVDKALLGTGSAVALCSLTTIIGYGSMIIANNLAIASFGLMAILGEFACVIFALYFLPAFLSYSDEKAGYGKE